MNLILSGGGNPEQVEEIDKYFIKCINKGKVLYIPIAMDIIPYSDCEKWFRETYNKYGLTNIDVCTNLKKTPNLFNYSAVFIGGGNTFKLLKEIKENKFDIKLKEYLEKDGIVYGGSAGAIIFGKSIETCINLDINRVNLTDLSGLNLLNNYSLWCHFNKEKDLIEKGKKIIALYEESGLVYDGKNIISLGKEYFIEE